MRDASMTIDYQYTQATPNRIREQKMGLFDIDHLSLGELKVELRLSYFVFRFGIFTREEATPSNVWRSPVNLQVKFELIRSFVICDGMPGHALRCSLFGRPSRHRCA